VADWGTGTAEALALLRRIKDHHPDVVIHLGDIYYSGAPREADLFYQGWCDALSLPDSHIATFTLAGNHDMYSGGGPYYDLLDRLGQPASYFCLRNDNWQFLALDTGRHGYAGVDLRELRQEEPTYLEETEVAWLADKVARAGERKTVLLSHHQLFSAYESVVRSASGHVSVNERLYGQVEGLLPGVTRWFWGHEHNLTVYPKYRGVVARCIGHGAVPVSQGELPTEPLTDISVEDVHLGMTDLFYNHGYVLLELSGAAARACYYQTPQLDEPHYQEVF
jgi:3',5'-cyclic AMP phosphodiesterase CpdA